MTALAAVLMVGGLVVAALFAIGVVFLFGMMIYSEIAHVRAHPVEKAETQPQAVPARTAPGLSKVPA